MKLSLRPLLVSALTLSALAFSSHANAADFVDTFTDSSNVGSSFSEGSSFGVDVSAGDLTLTRTQTSLDMGVDWRPASTGAFSFSAYSSFRLTATSAINDGYYVVSAVRLDGLGDYINEVVIQGDSNALGTFTYDLSSIGGSAEQWYARIRINPYAYDDSDSANDPAFVFSEFAALSAVPEPATYALLVGGFALSAVTFNRRRLRASSVV